MLSGMLKIGSCIILNVELVIAAALSSARPLLVNWFIIFVRW